MIDFTQGKPGKQILLFSLPMLVGSVFQQVYSMVDVIVVGQYISGRALAAVGTASVLLSFLVSLLIGLTTGASVVISQYYGARNMEELRRAVSTSIVFLAALSILIAVLGVLFSPLLLRLLNTSGEILEDAALYLRILMAGMILPIFYNMYTAYLRALGDSKGPLYILIFSTLLNVALDYLFVAVLRRGVGGAAWATVIAQTLAAVLCYFYARRYAPMLRVEKLLFDQKLFRSILSYSIPAAIQLSMTSLATLTISRLINSFGPVAMAGYTAATKIDQFAIMPLSNISMAVSTFVAQNIGAGDEERSKQGLRSAISLMVGLSLGISALVILFGKPLTSLFIDAADPDAGAIVATGQRYLSIIVLFYFLFAVFFAFNGFFRGVGDAVIVMILTIFSLSLRAVFAHVFVELFAMGPEAVAWSIPIGWTLCSLLAFIYYRRRMWAGKALVAAPPGETASESP